MIRILFIFLEILASRRPQSETVVGSRESVTPSPLLQLQVGARMHKGSENSAQAVPLQKEVKREGLGRQ